MERYLEEFLARHGIRYTPHAHAAVFTAAEAAIHCKDIPGLACKNLFMKDGADQFHLVILPDHKRLDMARFRQLIGAERLRFGNDEELMSLLRLTPGSVSPFGLVNDLEKKIVVHIDAEVWGAPVVTFHPNINTETLELLQGEFRKLFAGTGHAPQVMR